MEELLSFTGLGALLSLTSMIIVLDIDNVVFVSILVSGLKPNEQERGLRLALAITMLMRVILLLGVGFLAEMKEPLFILNLPDFLPGQEDIPVSIRSLIMLAGGLFLIAKATTEIHQKLEGGNHTVNVLKKEFRQVLGQIILLDLIFSIDSVITAIGMSHNLWIMAISLSISMILMNLLARPIGRFVSKHPSVKILALSFLILIGMMLFLESLEFHIPKSYIYFAMSFSLLVELLNIKAQKKGDPVSLKSPELIIEKQPQKPPTTDE